MDPNTTARISELVKSIASKYDNQRVVILGKGASADAVEPGFFESNLVIGLNDAEWIANCDISIFHESWVYNSVSMAGFRSKSYITSLDIQEAPVEINRVPFLPLAEDSADLMMSRLLDESAFYLEEVMLLTGLKLALMTAEIRGLEQEVFLIGMDFDPNSGYSAKIEADFAPVLADHRAASVEAQEHFLKHAIYLLKGSSLKIQHIGHRDFSQMSPAQLNMSIGYKPAYFESVKQEEQEVLITAEITTNHFGDRGRLEKLIRECKSAGADFVKFQKRDVETFYDENQLKAHYSSPFGTTFGDYRRALELGVEDLQFIAGLTDELGIGWFMSVLDKPSYEFMRGFNPEMLKLPSTISEHKSYLEYVAGDFAGDLVLSTGMTDIDYEKWVINTFKVQKKLFLLHANSAYPTPDEDCNIAVIRHYSKLSEQNPRIIPGWSSHDAGWFGSTLAVAAGARMVEKHVKLGNTEWAHFDSVALDLSTSAFHEYVTKIRKAQVILGSSRKRVTPSEHHKYRAK